MNNIIWMFILVGNNSVPTNQASGAPMKFTGPGFLALDTFLGQTIQH